MTTRIGPLVASLLLLSACGGDGDKCGDDEKVLAFADLDGDGWGSAEIGRVCRLGNGEAERDGDCNDEDDAVHPGATEDCNGVDDDCDGAYDDGLPGSRPFYQDADGDKFGNPEVAVSACLAPDGYTDDDDDCDDDDGEVNPRATEVCNGGTDDDCDGLRDDEDDSIDPTSRPTWYADQDFDGYGRPGAGMSQCTAPTGGVDNADDCDDDIPEANPDGTEVCNQVDDDCDGLFDDLDDSIDPALLMDAYEDADADGAGNPFSIVQVCRPRTGVGVDNDQDCDDSNAGINPNESEVACDTFDNDCDPATTDDPDRDLDGWNACGGDCDDLDASVNPVAVEVPADATDSNCDGLEDCHEDLDGDGARSAGTVPAADPNCTNAPHVPPNRPLDCDDNDAEITWSGQWVLDEDGDGYGSAEISLEQCDDPGPPYQLMPDAPDCDDDDLQVFPGAFDQCNDGVDSDCDGDDDCVSCADWYGSDPTLVSGVYTIFPVGGTARDVWCDMETDGGGWTLVASTAGQTLNDASGQYHNELTTLFPAGAHVSIWSGMVDLMPTGGDMRFTCKLDRADPTFAVDLSFYNVDWYATIVDGSDFQTCFSEIGNPVDPPRRVDNIAAVMRPLGDPFDGGGLVGEDTCGDMSDFAVDFDDRGIDGNEADGTDWGEDDGKEKCTASNMGDAWFIFVRE